MLEAWNGRRVLKRVVILGRTERSRTNHAMAAMESDYMRKVALDALAIVCDDAQEEELGTPTGASATMRYKMASGGHNGTS